MGRFIGIIGQPTLNFKWLTLTLGLVLNKAASGARILKGMLFLSLWIQLTATTRSTLSGSMKATRLNPLILSNATP